jgi:hypothetical protein
VISPHHHIQKPHQNKPDGEADGTPCRQCPYFNDLLHEKSLFMGIATPSTKMEFCSVKHQKVKL